MQPRTSEPAPTAGSFFIAFEGPEGAGKSTQIALLGDRLRRAGIEHVLTREPGGTRAGDRIRDVILDPALEVAPLTEFLLYSASRAQLVHEVIAPTLHGGGTVVTDRFAGASLAYQGYGRGLDLEFIRSLSARATSGIEPDLTIFLDLEPEAGLGRVARRGATDRLERAAVDFHRRVRDGFLALAQASPRWRRLDATIARDALAERIWQLVAEMHPALSDAATHAPEDAP